MRGTRYRPMVRWYSPRQLGRTAIEMVSARLVTRVVDPRSLERSADPCEPLDAWADRDEVWIDYVADIGDGWNPTFSVARAVAQERLELRDPALQAHGVPRADILFFGGDLVYPSPRDDHFDERLLRPYEEALAKAEGGEATVLAIPGNHDWYDGLATFSHRFCQPGQAFGAWRTAQSRSYFGVPLPGGWWLVGVDVEPGARIEGRQRRNFEALAEKLGAKDRVILAMPKPDWLGRPLSWNETTELPTEQMETILGRPIDVCLSGDLHHYRRHETIPCEEDPRVLQRITCGGGGAFMSPTHGSLPRRRRNKLDLRAAFPPAADSRSYRRRLLAFPFTNPSFGSLPAALYALLAFSAYPGPPVDPSAPHVLESFRDLAIHVGRDPWSLLVMTILVAAPMAFREGGNRLSTALAGLHSLAQGATALGTIMLSWWIAGEILPAPWPWGRPELMTALAFVLGWGVGASMMGFYLWLSATLDCMVGRAYAALRIEDWKSFLRICVRSDGSLTIFPVGLRRVARDWRRVPADGREPTLQPEDDATAPELIEVPIEIAGA